MRLGSNYDAYTSRFAAGLSMADAIYDALSHTGGDMTNTQNLETLIQNAKAAQKRYSGYSQAQVDRIFKKAALAATPQVSPLPNWPSKKPEWASSKTK